MEYFYNHKIFKSKLKIYRICDNEYSILFYAFSVILITWTTSILFTTFVDTDSIFRSHFFASDCIAFISKSLSGFSFLFLKAWSDHRLDGRRTINFAEIGKIERTFFAFEVISVISALKQYEFIVKMSINSCKSTINLFFPSASIIFFGESDGRIEAGYFSYIKLFQNAWRDIPRYKE